jgi:hypothetical protein
MSRSDSVLESFLVWPLAAAALAGKANVRFLEDLMSSVSGTQEEAQKSAENLKARYLCVPKTSSECDAAMESPKLAG